MMPPVEVVIYREDDGSVPLRDWLDGLSAKVRDKCYVALERLEELGHELRRPVADYLQDGIYELRVHHRHVNYRMMYFFFARKIVVVSHGLMKEQRIPPQGDRTSGKTKNGISSTSQKPHLRSGVIAMQKTKMPRSAALQHLQDRYIGKNPKRIASIEEERANLDIACKIHELRTNAGLSQRELAKRIGTSAANICRLENADYRGHSLSMLRRIAATLEMRVDVRFLPIKRKPAGV